MTLKWISALIAAAALAAFATANIVALQVPAAAVPFPVNLLLIAVGVVATILVGVADLYQRLDARVGVLSDFLVTRLDEIVTRLDDLQDAQSLETILNQPDVVPLTPLTPRTARGRRGEDH